MKMVLFDWNGTLFNDAQQRDEAQCATFRRFGAEPPSVEEFFREFTGDYLEIYRNRGIKVTREELEDFYNAIYPGLAENATLVPHAEEVLRELRHRKCVIGLVTAQQENLVRMFMEKFGVTRFFSYCVYGTTKKSEEITSVRLALRVAPYNCYFVGDAPADILHANRAGVISVAYFNEELTPEQRISRGLFVGEAAPHHSITSLDEIPKLIQRT